MDNQRSFWQLGEAWEQHGLDRREFLRLLTAGASLATIGGILAACGGTDPTATTAAPTRAAATTAPNPPATAAAAAPTTAAPAVLTPTPPVTVGATTVAAQPTTAPTAAARPASPTAAASTAPRGGTITTAIAASDANNFHPYLTTDATSSDYQGYVYGGGSLAKYNRDTLEVVGNAAQRIQVSDDKRTYTYTLKDNLVWSDGKPITSEDYLWTYQQANNPANKYPYIAFSFGPIESVTAPDPKTVVVTLKEAIGPGPEKAGFPITPLPKHVWEKYPWGDPVANPEINKPTVTCGMWNLQEWRKSERATFAANDRYHDGRPNIDTFVVRIFGTRPVAYQALKAGEIDFYDGIPEADVKEAKTLPNLNFYDWYSAQASWTYMGFNFRRPALQDINVRRAIAHATDQQGIIESFAYGLGKPIYSNYPPASFVYNENVTKYEFDPSKSAELFKQAGYTMQGGKLTKGGQPLTLKILYNTGNQVREGVATLMQQQLGELGANVEVQGIEFQAYLDLIKKEPYDYDLYVLGWRASVDPDGQKVAYSETNIPSLNSGAYVNKRVEELYAQGLKETDREKRKAIYGEIQKILSDDLPYVFLYTSQNYSGFNKKVGGVQVTQRLGLNEMNKWFINR